MSEQAQPSQNKVDYIKSDLEARQVEVGGTVIIGGILFDAAKPIPAIPQGFSTALRNTVANGAVLKGEQLDMARENIHVNGVPYVFDMSQGKYVLDVPDPNPPEDIQTAVQKLKAATWRRGGGEFINYLRLETEIKKPRYPDEESRKSFRDARDAFVAEAAYETDDPQHAVAIAEAVYRSHGTDAAPLFRGKLREWVNARTPKEGEPAKKFLLVADSFHVKEGSSVNDKQGLALFEMNGDTTSYLRLDPNPQAWRWTPVQ